MKTFDGKTAVITGAGSGLGRSLALQLSAAGAGLALCDLNPDGLVETLAALGAGAARTSLHRVDVREREQMRLFAAEALERHGALDLLINNAGISLSPRLFEDISDGQFENVLAVNMWGVYNGLRVFLPHLRTRPEAHIVNISSLAGQVGLYGYSAYSMSKFAVRGLSEALQSELAGSRVKLLAVYPGGVKTSIIKNAPDLLPEQRAAAHENFSKTALLSADEAARRILKAVRQNRSSLVLGWDARLVVALRALLPGRFPSVIRAVFSRAMFAEKENHVNS